MQSKEFATSWLYAEKHSLLLRHLPVRWQPNEDYDEPEEGPGEDFQPDASDEQVALLSLRLPIPHRLPLRYPVAHLGEGQ